MKSDFRLVLTIVCAVSFIYVLRDSDTSPAGFLRHQVSRLLDDNTYTQKFCSGIDLDTDITTSKESQAETVRSTLNKVRKGNPLINFIEGDEPRSEFTKKYVVPVLAFGAPWIIFFIITIFVCFGFLINWCCMYCSCCRCCKCCEKPKYRGAANRYAGASVFFGVATVAVAVAGIIVSRGVSTGGKQTVCAGVTLLEKLAMGDNSQKWLGVKPLADKLFILLSEADATLTNITGVYPTAAGGYTGLYTTSGSNLAYKSAVTDIQSLYNTYSGKTVSRADPAASSSSSTYIPTYIQNLGPDTTATTNTGLIEAEMDDKNTRVSTAASTIDSSIAKLAAFDTVYRDGFQSAEESAQNASISMGKLMAKIDPFATTAQTAFNAIGGGLLGLFVLEGVLALFAMASIFFVCKNMKSFNKGVHLSWCCIALLSLLTWILATVTLPTSLILFEVCDASTLFINDATFFNQTFDKFLPAEVTEDSTASSIASGLSGISVVGGVISSSTTDDDDDKDSSNKTITKARKILYNCLFAEQDLLVLLNASDTIGIFNDVMKPMDDVADVTGTITVDSVQIPLQQTAVAAYESGTTADGTEVTTDLATLNKYTNTATESCASVLDTWVLSSTLCTTDMGYVFQSTDDETKNIGVATCIGFDVWANKVSTKRYTATQYPTTCASVDSTTMLEYVQTFVTNFDTARQNVATIFTGVSSKLTTISSDNTAFISKIETATSKYPSLRSATPIWYAAVTDADQGVYYNSKCTFVKESLQTVHDAMCTGFIVSLFQAAVAIVIISFMSTLAFLMLFCLSKRFVEPVKGAKAKGGADKYAYK